MFIPASYALIDCPKYYVSLEEWLDACAEYDLNAYGPYSVDFILGTVTTYFNQCSSGGTSGYHW